MNGIQISEIKQIELEINFYKEQTAKNIIEIGKRLIQAKEMLPHGEWGKWLEEKVEFTQQTANKFMRVASEMGEYASMRNLGTAKLFSLLSLPSSDREEFIESNPVEDMTTRELQQAIKEKKELEKQVEELKNQEPEIIEVEKEVIKEVEIVPDDYEELKSAKSKAMQNYRELCYEHSALEGELQRLKRELSKEGVSKEEFNKLKKEYEEKVNEVHDLKEQVKQAVVTDTKEIHIKRLQDTAIVFSNRVHSFINDVGGLGWLVDYLHELPDYEKVEYMKSLELIERWVQTIKSNL